MKKPTESTLTPLAREVYRRLVRHLRTTEAEPVPITYGELAVEVSKAIPIHPRSSRLHHALGEVTEACRARELPLLPAIVCRADTQRPSDGYYKVAHPRARSFKTAVVAWELERARVVSGRERFPATL